MNSDVFVLGVATSPAADRRDDVRLEELAYHTVAAGLRNAGVTRAELDNVTIGAVDEFDGRPISSMLMAAPAGAFLNDEIRVTDSGLTALCLSTARHASGDFDLGVVVSWCKSSKPDVAAVMNARAEPFYSRELGMSDVVADALFSQAVGRRFGIDDAHVARLVREGYLRARRNPRGVGRPAPPIKQIARSDILATPLRALHRAPATDGAACLVVASARWVRRNPGCQPLAKLAGVGWFNDSYRLDQERLASLTSFGSAWGAALDMAGADRSPDVIELECPTGYHDAAYREVLATTGATISPSGGVYAQNPLTAAGLVNAVEAVLQVSGRAGPVQVHGARRAVAHSCHGYAQQANVVVVVDGVEGQAR